MAQFRKKPVVIEAHQFLGLGLSDQCLRGAEALDDWLAKHSAPARWVGNSIVINTLEGKMTAKPGDWIIRGVAGEFYPCKPDIFTATYESENT